MSFSRFLGPLVVFRKPVRMPIVRIFWGRRIAWLLAAMLPSASVLADWPEFRGPTGQGHGADTRPPAEWSPTKNVAWKAPISGLGWSSPIVQEGVVYLTTAVSDAAKKEQVLRVVAIDDREGGRALERRSVSARDETHSLEEQPRQPDADYGR